MLLYNLQDTDRPEELIVGKLTTRLVQDVVDAGLQFFGYTREISIKGLITPKHVNSAPICSFLDTQLILRR